MPIHPKAMDGGSLRLIRPIWLRTEFSVPLGAKRTRMACPTTTKGMNNGTLKRNSTGLLV